MGLFRLILAISVAIDHSGSFWGLPIMAGNMAVESFFIISGFYIAFIYNEKYSLSKNPYFLFITNRFLRIFPLYWIILALITLCSLIFLSLGLKNYFTYILSYFEGNTIIRLYQVIFVIFSNTFIFGQGIGNFIRFDSIHGQMFFSDNPFSLKVGLPFYWYMLIPQAWTLELEILFYLLAPFIIKNKWKLLFLGILSMFIRIVIYLKGYTYDPWIYRFFPSELIFFLIGVWAYYVYKKILYFFKKWLFISSSILTITLFLISFYLPPLQFYGFNLLAWSYYLSLLIFIPLSFIYTKKNTFDRIIGELSYPVYLIHFFVIDLLDWLQVRTPASKSYFSTLVVLISLIFSILLLRFFIIKMDIYREKRLHK